LKTSIALILILVLAACQPSPQPTVNTAAAQKMVLEAEIAYEAVLTVAVAYNKRPRCTEPRTVITCSDPTTVARLRVINAKIMESFVAAMNVASTPGITESKVVAAIAVATQGIPVLQSILESAK